MNELFRHDMLASIATPAGVRSTGKAGAREGREAEGEGGGGEEEEERAGQEGEADA